MDVLATSFQMYARASFVILLSMRFIVAKLVFFISHVYEEGPFMLT